jgi:hypothetical protein
MPSELEVLNADMTRPATMDTNAMPWAPSPSGSVLRKRVHMLGAVETAQVTSVVRYLPGAKFPAHDHPEGEEILVLEGTFSDEHGDWPAGSHLLNPEGFRHEPFSRDGCLLFVKLRQYPGVERASRKTDTRALLWQPTADPGIAAKPLDEAAGFPDQTRLERWAGGSQASVSAVPGGVEIFVIEGAFENGESRHDAGAWLRLPDGAPLDARSRDGCVLYVKRGAVGSLRQARA